MKKVPKKGLKLQGQQPQLTPLEKEILYYLTQEFLTVEQIATRRGTSKNAIYKVRKKLLSYGLINKANIATSTVVNEVEKKGGHSKQPLKNQIRLHAEQYHLNLIWCDGKYRELTKGGVHRFSLDDNTIMCYRNSIEVYSNSSFFGLTPAEADSKAMNYWTRLFSKLETKLKVVLVKQGSLNITRVRAEFAETNNELAKSALKEHQKIRITGDDNKTWLIVDNSFNLSECETVHPTGSKHDMQSVVQPFFNDLRNNTSLLPSQLSKAVLDTQRQLNEFANGLNSLTTNVNGLVSLMRSTSKMGQANLRDEEPSSGVESEGVFYVG